MPFTTEKTKSNHALDPEIHPKLYAIGSRMQHLITTVEDLLHLETVKNAEISARPDCIDADRLTHRLVEAWCGSYLDIEQVLVAMLNFFNSGFQSEQYDDHHLHHLSILEELDSDNCPLQSILGHQRYSSNSQVFWSDTWKEAFSQEPILVDRNLTHDQLTRLLIFRECHSSSASSPNPLPEHLGVPINPPGNYQLWYHPILQTLVKSFEFCSDSVIKETPMKRDSHRRRSERDHKNPKSATSRRATGVNAHSQASTVSSQQSDCLALQRGEASSSLLHQNVGRKSTANLLDQPAAVDSHHPNENHPSAECLNLESSPNKSSSPKEQEILDPTLPKIWTSPSRNGISSEQGQQTSETMSPKTERCSNHQPDPIDPRITQIKQAPSPPDLQHKLSAALIERTALLCERDLLRSQRDDAWNDCARLRQQRDNAIRSHAEVSERLLNHTTMEEAKKMEKEEQMLDMMQDTAENVWRQVRAALGSEAVFDLIRGR